MILDIFLLAEANHLNSDLKQMVHTIIAPLPDSHTFLSYCWCDGQIQCDVDRDSSTEESLPLCGLIERQINERCLIMDRHGLSSICRRKGKENYRNLFTETSNILVTGGHLPLPSIHPPTSKFCDSFLVDTFPYALCLCTSTSCRQIFLLTTHFIPQFGRSSVSLYVMAASASPELSCPSRLLSPLIQKMMMRLHSFVLFSRRRRRRLRRTKCPLGPDTAHL